MIGAVYSIASAIFRIDKACQPSSWTIFHRASRILHRTSSFNRCLRSIVPITYTSIF